MTRLIQKTIIPYKGNVYDLTVSNSHTYNVEKKAVHNSGAGSLICYLLGITQPDPIKYGLLFERFQTKKKVGAADIDSDFSDRDKAVKILIEHFGEKRVIPVTNFAQLQLRSLIKDIGKLYGMTFEEVNKYTAKIEQEALSEAKKQEGFDRGVWVLTFEEAEKNSATFRKLLEEKPEFAATIKVLFKQMRQIGRHAGGVVITENAFDSMPLIKAGGELQTPWAEGVNFRHLESFGFLKFDILGLGTLRMFEDCIRRILKKKGVKYPTFTQVKNWFDEHLHPDVNNYDDQEVYQNVYWNKKFIGVFQFINPASQSFVSEMKPTCINDIAIATSIFRPGPLALGVDKQFLRNRQNSDSIKFKHPLLKEILGPTSGLLIFQEQLQLIYHKLAGIPLDETDNIRKAFTKKEISNKEKAKADILKLKQTFMQLCKENNGIEESVTEKVFDEMEALVAYSFNRCLHPNTIVESKERGLIKIKDVKIGENVNSNNGFIRVNNVFQQGKKKVYKIKTKNGKELICTLDHKLETPLGMKTVKEIFEFNIPILTKDNI